ncbi:hypothetical protein Pse7367_3736 (plasmid) [Thalassoporum mexicanum PCC 7367]|uniref:hypothetical protein n=1 Tax=Thalassoporum mexicanum TaxID=3457544 RepID=UPI00029FC8BD|nr:hypothetical protein [Pseudanabaena sp. PCC 7367]AFY71962.1 hypothetical protein Pse7367_3736 [Pseudanabaena sp. PCC 7367]
MTIKRKPKDVNEFIREGGDVPAQSSSKEKKSTTETAIKLRLGKDLLDELDEHLASKRVPPSRNKWILQAIVERLDRDKS